MSKVKILVVEDEIVIADDICDTLEDLGYEVLEPAINYTQAVTTMEEDLPDIAILDIQLAGKKDGIDLAWKIREDFDIPFIFLTSNSDHQTVGRAKKVNPPAYLVKPFNKADLFTSIEIALHNYANQHRNESEEETIIKEAFFVKEKDLFYKVKFQDILFIKSDHVYLEIWTEKRKFLTRGSMNSIETQLPSHFYRTHRSYIVNLDQLEAINSMYVLVGDEKIPIGRSYREDLLAKVNIQ